MPHTKRLGVVGGIGPDSTIEYYRAIIAIHRELLPEAPDPSVLINSIDVRTLLALVGKKDFTGMVAHLRSAVDTLADGGADFAILAAVTPHIVFDELQAVCRIPLLSIVDATRDYAQSLALHRVGLLGTRFTMQAPFFPAVFARSHMAIVVPRDEEQQYVHTKYVDELLKGILLAETRNGILDVVRQMKDRDAIDSVILGGTDLSLIIKDTELFGLPVLDATQIHARAAVHRLIQP